jgi:hypothetical protein
VSIYFIHPEITVGSNEIARKFFNACYGELEEHIDVVKIKSTSVLLSVSIEKSDSVVFFNKSNTDYNIAILNFLDNANNVEARIYPIALSEDLRIPPSIISKPQSYDVKDQLRRRSLSESNIATLGLSLARIIISRMQPTLMKEKLNMFISHRRKDGEELAAVIYEELVKRSEIAFRDLINITVGEEAQEIIERNLKKSDIILFLDTPKAGESKWIKKELKMALELNIPIVWIKFGGDECRAKLEIKPADKPHFISEGNISNGLSLELEFIDDIIHKAFTISRKSADLVLGKYSTIKNLTRANGYKVDVIDKYQMIYRLEVPRKNGKYPERPLIHFLQCYGRIPLQQDKERLVPILRDKCYDGNSQHNKFYDAVFLLSPIRGSDERFNTQYVIESFDEYIAYLDTMNKQNNNTKDKKKGVIISGAFPDCEPEYQQYLLDAIHSISQEILVRKGTLIFGAHPTFQTIIFGAGKQYRSDNYVSAIRMYVAKNFVTDMVIEDNKKNAQVIVTDNIDNNRDLSLTLMRKTMINDNDATAIICIGGKTKQGGHKPGVDEEIQLAKERGIPVFLIGSAGGRASEIASYYEENNSFSELNSLSYKENQELNNSMDYRLTAKKILDSIGL